MDFVKSHLQKSLLPKVFNWSEFHFSEVTYYKIHTLRDFLTFTAKVFLGDLTIIA